MITEICPHCHNTVVGQFNPSNTRKYLTGLAKTGGMKAVLTAVGSVIPGFGNIAGLLVGGTIDLIYGNDIKKIIDKIADVFDDNKVYVFECPQCGHSWACQEELYEDGYTSMDDDTTYLAQSDEDAKDGFEQFFEDYLHKADEIAKDPVATKCFMAEISNIQDELDISNVLYAQDMSKYCFLAAFAGFLCINEKYDETIQKESKHWIDKAGHRIPQYALLSHMIDIAGIDNPDVLLQLMKATKKSWFSDENGLFKSEYIISLYEEITFWNVVFCRDNFKNTDLSQLWDIVRGFDNNAYSMYANAELYDYISNTNFDEAERYLVDAVKTSGFDIDSVDGDNFFGAKWLECYVAYGDTLIDGDGLELKQDVKRGLYVLRKAIKKAKGETRDSALYSIAVEYETGEHIEKDIEKARKYYDMISDPDYADRMKKVVADLNTIERENKDSGETEYMEELKACFEDGEMSKSERRLLEELRIKLGISETRAAELEASLHQPKLTEAELEYLDEYRECLTENGRILAGERRLLNHLRIKLGICEERARELEIL